MPGTTRPVQLTLGSYGPPGLNTRFVLGPELVASHKHVMGLTGQGKSKMLASMFVQLLNQGVPAALIDPHSDLATDVLGSLIDTGFFRSPRAYERLLYVDFSDRQRFLPFNVLSQRYPPHDVARHVVEACKRAWPALADGSAPQFENILLASSLVLTENRLPLTEMPRLLTDKPFRDGLLTRVRDGAIVEFFHGRFDRWGKDAPLMIESTLRRIFLLTFSPTLRYSLGQPENLLDFRQLMDSRTSVIFNLGGLDEETQRLIGSLLTVGFEVASLSRADLPMEQRGQYHLVIDEFSMFSAQSEEALARVLSLARKYGLYLTLAHQTWSQLSSRLQGAMQNSLEIAFRLGRSDADWAAARFGRVEPHAVKHEVEDVMQAGRVHPLFYPVSEQQVIWAQALSDLKPREAMVNTGNKTVQIKTLAVPPVRASVQDVERVTEEYARRLLRTPKSEEPLSSRSPLSRVVAVSEEE